MPGTYTIDATRRLVLSRAWGVIIADELLCHVRALRVDPAFEPSFRQLADLRGVTGLDFGVATIRELASLNPFAPEARRAIVLGSDIAYGVIRMYLLFRGTSTPGIHVFRQMAPAMEWLGLADADAAAINALIKDTPLVSA